MCHPILTHVILGSSPHHRSKPTRVVHQRWFALLISNNMVKEEG